jgi:MFS family permease
LKANNNNNINNTFRAFRNRNYALYFSGQSVSLIGTWMQRTAVAWVVYTITHSAFMLGLAVFASQFPSFVFSLYGGILSDRYNRHKILLITQTASMVQAGLLALLLLTNHFIVWQILSLSVTLGIINAFDVPARQPLVHELVNDKADIPNAMALNSSMINVARLVGPALSGLVLQNFGAGICFLLNTFSFLAVIISLLLMKLVPLKPKRKKTKIRTELSEGFTYLKNTPEIGKTILILTIAAFLVLPYDTIIPVFAKVIFKGNASTFGYISSFIGLGAISGSFFLASLKSGANLKSKLFVSMIILGVGLILFSHMNIFPLAMFFAIIFGFGVMMQNTICMTIVQVESDPKMRGRVMSFVAMGFFGMLPLGSLLIGFVSQKIGAPNTLLFQGIAALVIAAVFSKFLKRGKPEVLNPVLLESTENQILEKV